MVLELRKKKKRDWCGAYARFEIYTKTLIMRKCGVPFVLVTLFYTLSAATMRTKVTIERTQCMHLI